MIEAAELALEFSRDREREDLDRDKQFQFAFLHAVQITLEAASRVSEPTRATMPELPWKRLVGMRNRVVHAYFDMDLDIVWDAVRNRFPSLVATVRQLLD